MIVKPPIGVKPRWLHDEHRIHELRDAIRRFVDLSKPIPPEWVEEYNELSQKLEKRYDRRA